MYESPVPHADFVTSTTHKTLRGPRSGIAMCRAEHAKAVDKWVFPGIQGGPLMHVIAAKAVCFGEALQPGYKTYVKRVVENAQTLGRGLVEEGLRIVSGGTDCHLLLVDLQSTTVNGKQAEHLLEEAGITCNKNMIPYDPRKPAEASGVRLGTPALTTRGFGTAEMDQIARWIGSVLKNPDDAALRAGIRREIAELTSGFPLHKKD